MKKVEEIMERSPLNQHTDKVLVDLEDVNWFVEQAERVQELEAENTWLYGKLNQISDVIESGRKGAKRFK